MLELCALASGSRGNAYVVGAAGSYLLVDCGISCRRIHRALDRLGVALSSLEGILVTHEHRDHIAGLEVFRRSTRVPLYLTAGTWDAAPFAVGPGPVRPVEPSRTFTAGPFRVHPFPVSHDAAEPVGFVLACDWGAAAFATDLGWAGEAVLERISGVRALVLESNHDEEMLRNGPYPWHLKERIRSRRGHLSNRDSRSAIGKVAGAGLEAVVLAHLSEENNHPALALAGAREALAARGLETVHVAVARQEGEGELLRFA